MISDNDIKEALECCVNDGGKDDCSVCPNLKSKENWECKEEITALALDLINRQQAEIEKLNVELVGMRGACESYKMHYDNAQAEIERLQKDNEYILMQHKFDRRPNGDCWNDVIEKAKTEAIKEFWKRFDKVLCENIGPSKRVYWEISSDGNNLVKEMTEVSE